MAVSIGPLRPPDSTGVSDSRWENVKLVRRIYGSILDRLNFVTETIIEESST